MRREWATSGGMLMQHARCNPLPLWERVANRRSVAKTVSRVRGQLKMREENPSPAPSGRPSPTRGEGIRARRAICAQSFPIQISNSQRCAARLSWRAGRAYSKSSPLKSEGMERRLALNNAPFGAAPCEGARALRRSSAAFFDPGPRFPEAFAPAISQAPGGRTVVSSRWSPGSPESGMPAGRGGRETWGSLSRPLCPEVSGPHLRPVPPACSAFKTPHESAPRRAGCREDKGGFGGRA